MSKVEAVGDWDKRGRDLDGIFAQRVITDSMIDADAKVRKIMGDIFPGWALYRKIIAGVDVFDAKLDEWATTTAWALAKSEKVNGRRYISEKIAAKPGWVDQAGRDALDSAIRFSGFKHAVSALDRSEQFGVDQETYRKIRNPVTAGLCIGIDTYKPILHSEYLRLRWAEKSLALNSVR